MLSKCFTFLEHLEILVSNVIKYVDAIFHMLESCMVFVNSLKIRSSMSIVSVKSVLITRCSNISEAMSIQPFEKL